MATVIVVLLVPISDIALGHDHRRPKAVLKVEDETQKGRLVESSWVRKTSPRLCTSTDTTSPFRFPEQALKAAPGSLVAVRLRKAQPPHDVNLQTWHRINRRGGGRGEPEIVPTTLVPRVRDDEVVAWDVQFQPLDEKRHYYLLLEVHWDDEEGCGSPQPLDEGLWITFHLRATNLY